MDDVVANFVFVCSVGNVEPCPTRQSLLLESTSCLWALEIKQHQTTTANPFKISCADDISVIPTFDACTCTKYLSLEHLKNMKHVLKPVYNSR